LGFKQTVIHQSVQSFSRNGNGIEIVLVDHEQDENTLRIVEVIAYDPALREEAPRLYVNANLLLEQIPYSAFHNETEKGFMHGDDWYPATQRRLMTKYIVTRLNVLSTLQSNVLYSPRNSPRALLRKSCNKCAWYVILESHPNGCQDSMSGEMNLTLLCERPAQLVPAVVSHVR
jgi:hypothetical protein